MQIISSGSFKKMKKTSSNYDPYPYGYWLDENGKLIEVGTMQHGKVVRELLRAEMKQFAESKKWDVADYISNEAYNFAFDKGWIRIVNPNSKNQSTSIEFFTITNSQIGPLLKLLREHYKYVREDLRTFFAHISQYTISPKNEKYMEGRQYVGNSRTYDYPKAIEFLSSQVTAPKEPWGPVNPSKEPAEQSPSNIKNKHKKTKSACGWYRRAFSLTKSANLDIFYGFPYGYWITPDGTSHAVDTEQHSAKVAELIPKEEAYESMGDAYDAAFEKGFVRTVGPYAVYSMAELGIQIPHPGKSITQDQYNAIQSLVQRANVATRKDPRLVSMRVNLDYGFKVHSVFYTPDKALEKIRESIKAEKRKVKIEPLQTETPKPNDDTSVEKKSPSEKPANPKKISKKPKK